MPCYDYDQYPKPSDTLEVRNLRKENCWLTAALCLMTNEEFTGISLDKLLYLPVAEELMKESGITKDELLKWHNKHHLEDAKRRALAKLTEEDKKALGLIKGK